MHVQNMVVKNANKNPEILQNDNDKGEIGTKEESRNVNNGEKPVEYETW